MTMKNTIKVDIDELIGNAEMDLLNEKKEETKALSMECSRGYFQNEN